VGQYISGIIPASRRGQISIPGVIDGFFHLFHRVYALYADRIDGGKDLWILGL
jgi:hypothetical protein